MFVLIPRLFRLIFRCRCRLLVLSKRNCRAPWSMSPGSRSLKCLLGLGFCASAVHQVLELVYLFMLRRSQIFQFLHPFLLSFLSLSIFRILFFHSPSTTSAYHHMITTHIINLRTHETHLSKKNSISKSVPLKNKIQGFSPNW